MAEDEVMRILLLVRNFLPAHEEIAQGEVRSECCSHALTCRTLGVEAG